MLAEATKEAAKSDILITGDDKSGKIQHKKYDVSGVYKVDGQKIKVEVSENEWLVSCKLIEKKIAEWFKGK